MTRLALWSWIGRILPFWKTPKRLVRVLPAGRKNAGRMAHEDLMNQRRISVGAMTPCFEQAEDINSPKIPKLCKDSFDKDSILSLITPHVFRMQLACKTCFSSCLKHTRRLRSLIAALLCIETNLSVLTVGLACLEQTAAAVISKAWVFLGASCFRLYHSI